MNARRALGGWSCLGNDPHREGPCRHRGRSVRSTARRSYESDRGSHPRGRTAQRLGVARARAVGAILNHSPHGIIVSDANGKLVLQNKASESIWAGSASADNVAGWGKYRAFHSDGRPYEPTDWSMARALANHETTQPQEIHYQRFDDTHGVMLGSSAPIFTADGTLEGALSVFIDITRFKQQEEEIRLSAERYFTTLKSIGDAVIATDAIGQITFLNPVAETLTKWSAR